ncbi:MAG: hypothetical protein [Siphoviridae sp. ctdEk19]|nr:MAG: hypothetical protein [Siphoviridae sp. ctdEk19]
MVQVVVVPLMGALAVAVLLLLVTLTTCLR